MTSPAWSVIIPTFNRPERLRLAIHAVTSMTPPPGGFELIVVDDGGDADLSFVQQYRGVRLHRQATAGPARAPMLAFTDDDCAPAPDWLATLHRAMPNAAVPIALGGHTANALTDNPYAEASQILVDYLYQVENRDPKDAGFFTSNNLCLPAQGFHRIGGFDAGFPLAAGEDRDFCDRWRARGMRLCYVPEAVIHHYHPLTLRTFWRQHANYGRGARHPRRPRGDGQAARPLERLSFYRKLVSYPLSRGVSGRTLTSAGLLALAQAATVWGYSRPRQNRSVTKRA